MLSSSNGWVLITVFSSEYNALSDDIHLLLICPRRDARQTETRSIHLEFHWAFRKAGKVTPHERPPTEVRSLIWWSSFPPKLQIDPSPR